MASGIISDGKTIDLMYKTSNIVKKYDLNLGTSLSQIYRRNSVDLNCQGTWKYLTNSM